MSRLKTRFMLPIMSSLMAMSCMGEYDDPFIKPNNSVVVTEDKRRVGEPHTDNGAITKPYRKKDKLTRKERKARYGKIKTKKH